MRIHGKKTTFPHIEKNKKDVHYYATITEFNLAAASRSGCIVALCTSVAAVCVVSGADYTGICCLRLGQPEACHIYQNKDVSVY